MTAQVIDGKLFSARVKDDVARQIAQLKQRHGITPKLVVLLVGEDPASQVYVRNKGLAAEAAGMAGSTEILPVETSQAELLKRVHELNADASVHGILVQLPLPRQIDEAAIINAIDPDKDVDGFPCYQRRAAGHRSGLPGALHAAGLPADAKGLVREQARNEHRRCEPFSRQSR